MRKPPQPNRVNQSPGTPAMPVLGQLWWLPSAFAILALLLVFAVPAIVDHRLSTMRRRLVLGSEHARVLVNDLEAAFASELLLQRSGIVPPEASSVTSRNKLHADDAELHGAVRDLGPDVIQLYDALTTRMVSWSTTAHDSSEASAAQGFQLLAAAEQLDSALTTTSQAQRVEMARLESYYILTPAVLAPVALIAILIVMMSGRRMLAFARVAEEERANVLRAAETRAALLRGVTHDVKNPLGAALGYAQLLEEGIVGPLVPQQTEMVQRIHRLVAMSVHTVTDLLELARADGELQIEYASVDLKNVVRDVIDDHGGMARERHQELVVSAPPTPIVTDPIRVQQILANLLSNAIKYTPASGRITVSILRRDRRPDGTHGATDDQANRIGIEVRDSGPGIPHELQPRVFEEFFRVRAAGPGAVNGNGLGLAISRRIARLLGGDVTFADGDGGGAVFTLWFAAGAGEKADGDGET